MSKEKKALIEDEKQNLRELHPEWTKKQITAAAIDIVADGIDQG